MSKDLKTAHVYLSILGESPKQEILELVKNRKSYLRKAIATKIKLKYNPMLIFSLDASIELEERIQKVLDDLKKNEN